MRKHTLIWIFLIASICCSLVIVAFYHGRQAAVGNGPPMRIVSATPQLTEIMYGLGLEDRIVAVSSDSDYPTKARQKPSVGTFWQLNLEAVIAQKPDLVVIEDFDQQVQIGKRLEAMGYPVLVISIDNMQELFESIEKIGGATGKAPQAQEMVTNLRSGLIDLSGRLSSGKKYSVLWVIQMQPVRVAGRDTFINEFIELAGGKNAIGPTVLRYPPLGAEQIVASEADVIIIPAMAGTIEEQQKQATEYWSKFPSLPAVKNKRIYIIDPGPVCRLGPRIDKAVELIGRYVHPEMFSEGKKK